LKKQQQRPSAWKGEPPSTTKGRRLPQKKKKKRGVYSPHQERKGGRGGDIFFLIPSEEDSRLGVKKGGGSTPIPYEKERGKGKDFVSPSKRESEVEKKVLLSW